MLFMLNITIYHEIIAAYQISKILNLWHNVALAHPIEVMTADVTTSVGGHGRRHIGVIGVNCCGAVVVC